MILMCYKELIIEFSMHRTRVQEFGQMYMENDHSTRPHGPMPCTNWRCFPSLLNGGSLFYFWFFGSLGPTLLEGLSLSKLPKFQITNQTLSGENSKHKKKKKKFTFQIY